MKKTALFTALIAAAGVATTAQAAPTVYGKIDTSLNFDLDATDTKGKESTQMDLMSNATRIGVKGDVAINDDFKGIYKIELNGNLYNDESGANGISVGTRYLGLAGSFGEVKAGRFDTPMKEAKKDVDLAHNVAGFESDNEVTGSKIVQYTTPNLGGVTAALALVPRAGIAVNVTSVGGKQVITPIDGRNENGDIGVSASVAFEQDGIYVAAAYDTGVSKTYAQPVVAVIGATETDMDKVKSMGARLVAQLNMIENLQLGFMYDTYKADASKDPTNNTILASASYSIGSITPRGQITYVSHDSSNKETKMNLLLGADFAVAENVTAYTDFGYMSTDPGTSGSKKVNQKAIDLGVEYKF